MVRTHTFKLGKYSIQQLDAKLDGFCDLPDASDTLYMMIQAGGNLNALHTAIHEAMHAEGLPKRYLDGERDLTAEVARFLWRLGWRRAE